MQDHYPDLTPAKPPTRKRGERVVCDYQCPKCGGNERYRRSRECVTCKAARRQGVSSQPTRPRKRHPLHAPEIQARARQVALRTGEKFYQNETPCRHCGTRLHYTLSYHCVECRRRGYTKEREKITAERRAVYNGNRREVRKTLGRYPTLTNLLHEQERTWGYVWRGLQAKASTDVMRRLLHEWEYVSLRLDTYLGRYPFLNKPLVVILINMERESVISEARKCKDGKNKETVLDVAYSSGAWHFA
jgi:hypothetical protein